MMWKETDDDFSIVFLYISNSPPCSGHGIYLEFFEVVLFFLQYQYVKFSRIGLKAESCLMIGTFSKLDPDLLNSFGYWTEKIIAVVISLIPLQYAGGLLYWKIPNVCLHTISCLDASIQ